MDIMELGAIGELVGGVAVIATLIYLAIQVRQGNKTGNRESYRAWVSELNKVLFEPQRDPEFAELFQRANRDWDSISPRDQGVVNAVYSPIFMLIQEVFTQTEKGDAHEYLARQVDAFAASILQMPGTATWWERVSSAFYAPAFCNHIQEVLASHDCPPPLQNVLPWYVGDVAGQSNADPGA